MFEFARKVGVGIFHRQIGPGENAGQRVAAGEAKAAPARGQDCSAKDGASDRESHGISPLLRSWQKPRFLPAETKLMSDKRAGARLDDRRSARRVPPRGETHCVERGARMATQGLRAAGIA